MESKATKAGSFPRRPEERRGRRARSLEGLEERREGDGTRSMEAEKTSSMESGIGGSSEPPPHERKAEADVGGGEADTGGGKADTGMDTRGRGGAGAVADAGGSSELSKSRRRVLVSKKSRAWPKRKIEDREQSDTEPRPTWEMKAEGRGMEPWSARAFREAKQGESEGLKPWRDHLSWTGAGVEVEAGPPEMMLELERGSSRGIRRKRGERGGEAWKGEWKRAWETLEPERSWSLCCHDGSCFREMRPMRCAPVVEADVSVLSHSRSRGPEEFEAERRGCPRPSRSGGPSGVGAGAVEADAWSWQSPWSPPYSPQCEGGR